MSSVKYQKAYDRMTEKQKQIMANLYMKGINHDGHSWNTYGDIEDAVADLAEDWRKIMKEKKYDFEEMASKTETTSCEWCEGELSFEVVWHSFGSSFVDRAMYCPNCGRRLEEKNHGSKEND